MLTVVVRGGGDLASGIAVRLHHAGIHVIITEIENPLTVRRYVSFSEAVFTGSIIVEDLEANLVNGTRNIEDCLKKGIIPVVIDRDVSLISEIPVDAIVDARMLKKEVTFPGGKTIQKVGIGPGFIPGKNCDCVVETKRGPHLGRVYWKNPAEPDNGIPENVCGYESERVLRSPGDGKFSSIKHIGDVVNEKELIACVAGLEITAPFKGVIRGLLHDGIEVIKGVKVGDVDPRCDPSLCNLVSDKALAAGGGVLEAILTNTENRRKLGAG